MEKQNFSLFICSEKETREIKVEWIEVLSPAGEFLILRNHKPMISSVCDGESVRYKPVNGTPVSIFLSDCLLKIDRASTVTLFC